MYPRAKVCLLCLCIITGAASCSWFGGKKEKGTVLARVGSKYLYLEDLDVYLKENREGNDSLALVQDYVNNWIRQQVVLEKAEDNLSNEQKDKKRQVEDYRNTLIIYEYQKLLIHQQLDTVISEKQVEDYYLKNKQNFELKENIVRLRYAKLPGNAPNLGDFIRLFAQFDEKSRQKVFAYSAKYALNSYYDESAWLAFNDVIKEIPITTYDQEAWLRQNRFIHLENNNMHYLVYISDFRIKNDVSPLTFEKERIRNILLNQRRQKLIFDMEKKTLEDAQANGKVEIYK